MEYYESLFERPPAILETYPYCIGIAECPRTLFFDSNDSLDKSLIAKITCDVLKQHFGIECPLRIEVVAEIPRDLVVVYLSCAVVSHDLRVRIEFRNLFDGETCSLCAYKNLCEMQQHEVIHATYTPRENVANSVKRLKSNRNDDIPQSTSYDTLLNSLQIVNVEQYKASDSERSSHILDMFQRQILQEDMRDQYIRCVGLPLKLEMYSLKCTSLLNRNIPYVVHVGGCVVGKPLGIESETLIYYVVVVKIGEHTVPLYELVSGEDGWNSIESNMTFAFLTYRTFAIRKTKRWPIFKVVVTDWSWVLMHYVVNDTNGMNFEEYLHMCFEAISRNKPIPSSYVILHSCCSHFAKTVKTHFENEKHSTVRKVTFAITCIKLMIVSREIAEIVRVFKVLMKGLTSPHSADVIRVEEELKNLSTPGIDVEWNEETEIGGNRHYFEERDANYKLFSEEPFFEKSKFYELFRMILDGIEVSHPEENVDSPLFWPEMKDYVMEKLMPYVCIWTGILIAKVEGLPNRLSNAPIETYFHQTKLDTLDSQTRFKLGLFLEERQNFMESTVSMIKAERIM